MVRSRGVCGLLIGLLLCGSSMAQETVRTFAFEVASVKPVDPNADVTFVGVMNLPDAIDAKKVTLLMLIQNAYGYKVYRMADQVEGLPQWGKKDVYDVQAKMSEADAVEMQKLSGLDKQHRYELLMQSLLAERFGLKLHHGTRTGPDYELVIARGGSKLKPASEGEAGVAKDKDGKPFKNAFIRFNGGKCVGQNAGISLLAHLLSQAQEIGRPVVDKTGLTGMYSFTLNWAPTLDGMIPRAAAEDAPSVFTALEDDLGLKLVPSTGTEEILIVDAVQRPSEN